MRVINQHTLVELAKRVQGLNLLDIVNPLVERNPILEDAPFFPANNVDFHVIAKALKLAKGGTRGYNEGAPVGFSQVTDLVEPVVRYEFFSDLDEALVNKAPNKLQYRYDEDNLSMEGIRQDWNGNQFLYGNRSLAPRDMNGLMSRYNALSMANVADGGAAGGSSLLILGWGRNGIYFAYPQGSATMGIQRNDRGLQRTTPESGKVLNVYETQMVVEAALCVPDDRAVQRIANIDPASVADLDDMVIDAFNRMPDGGETAVLYCNRLVKAALDKAANNKGNAALGIENVFGRRVTVFWGRPVRLLEQLLTNESEVS